MPAATTWVFMPHTESPLTRRDHSKYCDCGQLTGNVQAQRRSLTLVGEGSLGRSGCPTESLSGELSRLVAPLDYVE